MASEKVAVILKEISDIAGDFLDRSKDSDANGNDKNRKDTQMDRSSNGGSECKEAMRTIKKKADEARNVMADAGNKGKDSKSWSSYLPWAEKKLQVYVPNRIKSTESFLADFKTHMKKMKVTLDINFEVSRVQTGALLVVSPNLSRLQPDIDSSLTGIERREKMVVLVLHYKRESSLPKLPSATQLVTDAKYSHIQFIDMAFDEKIYDCEMNSIAREQLSDFIGKL